MIDALDNGQMVTDLDANNFNILNLGHVTPPPPNLVAQDDPRLSDARPPLEGSVTDSSVAVSAAIDQSKLNLDGSIPSNWLGLDSASAAPGSLVEYLANKGIPGGYAGLDGTGKVPAGQLPSDVGTGTVTSVTLAMPTDFNVAGSPVTTSGTITVGWANIPDGTWFGNNSGVSAVPAFHTSPITAAMVPQLDASKIATGTINAALLPLAQGVGATSAPGIVPDPGPVGNPTDYLSRGMTYLPVPSIGPSYQPKADSPVIMPIGSGPTVIASISCPLTGVSLFYQVSGMTAYAELVVPPGATSAQITINSGQTINVYGAKAGYTNSDIASYTAP